MLNNLSGQKHWTKKEFIQKVNPCRQYRFRIWWFFLLHTHVALRHIINQTNISNGDKSWVIMKLDLDFWKQNVSLTPFSDAKDIKLLHDALEESRLN